MIRVYNDIGAPVDMSPNVDTLELSISATMANGKKLLEDAKLLSGWDRFSTALALAVLAQEEFAKSFLLQLVADGALPWLPEVQRSMARHECKHLLAIVMEWLPPYDWENLTEQHRLWTARHEQKMAWLQRRLDRYKQGNLLPDPDDPEPMEPDVFFPPDIETALRTYRHETTGKVRAIAAGSVDRKKQSALYVDITNTGEIGSHPGLITHEEASEAIEMAERLTEGPDRFSDEYRKLKEIVPLLFSPLKDKRVER